MWAKSYPASDNPPKLHWHRGRYKDMRCVRCGRDDLLVVYFKTVGTSTFAYCRHCEHRQWESTWSERNTKAATEEHVEPKAG